MGQAASLPWAAMVAVAVVRAPHTGSCCGSRLQGETTVRWMLKMRIYADVLCMACGVLRAVVVALSSAVQDAAWLGSSVYIERRSPALLNVECSGMYLTLS